MEEELKNKMAEYFSKMDIYDVVINENGVSFGCKGKAYNNKDTIYPINYGIDKSSLSMIKFADFLPNIAYYNKFRKTIGIDYKLLDEDTIFSLAALYQGGFINGIRILPRGKDLDQDIYDKFNNLPMRQFFDNAFIICADSMSIHHSRFDTRIQNGLCTMERINLLHYDQIVHDNIHINRELNDDELKQIAEISNKNKCDNIFFNIYNSTYYRHALEKLKEYGLREDICLTFLANPLYDNISEYDNLNTIVNNSINIHYNTCNDLNDFYKNRSSEGQYFYSDLEASGICSIDEYINMLNETVRIVDHFNSKEYNYTDLEKVAYLYDYFKKSYIYDPDYKTTPHELNSKLHNIVNRDRMICEGFSNWFSCILRRGGIKCFTVGVPDHQYNILRIKDDKYNVDNIALLDITNNLSKTTGVNNYFDYFLVPPDFYLYRQTTSNGFKYDGLQLNIASSLYVTDEDYENNVEISNPGYVIDHFGYTTRMLQLMGLNAKENSTRDEIRSAYLNSGLGKGIPSEKLVRAVNEVRGKEGDFLSATNEDFYMHNHVNRNNPIIKANDGKTIIPVNLLKPDLSIHFVETDTQEKSNNNISQVEQGLISNEDEQIDANVNHADSIDNDKYKINPAPEPSVIPPIDEQTIIDSSYSRIPELMDLITSIRSFNSSLMTKANYQKANKIVAKTEEANRIYNDDFHLDPDDELVLAQIKSMIDAYKAKSTLIQKLDDCELLIEKNIYDEDIFKECLQAFYDIIGHANYSMDEKRSTAIRTATTRKLISRNNYERFKKIFEYYKNWSNMSSKDNFSELNINIENDKKNRKKTTL